MKKYILISLMIILSSFCFAQTDEDLEQSMEDAQNQLLQILERLEHIWKIQIWM